MTRTMLNLVVIVKLVVSVIALACFFLQMQPIFQQFINGATTTGVHYQYRYMFLSNLATKMLIKWQSI
jgi:hypothetical protein